MMPLGLFRKELRQLLPWAIAVWSLELAGGLWSMFAIPPDTAVWAQMSGFFHNGIFEGVMLLVWALVLAYAGFPRESDDGTLPFLFALPVRRSALFLGKAAAAATVLLGSVALGDFFEWVHQVPNTTSFGGQTFRLQWALISFAMTSAVALIALGYALFLAVLRRFGLLVAFLLLSLVQFLEDQRAGARRLSPVALLDLEFDGAQPLIPWFALFGHGVIAAALAAIAGYAWVGRTETLAGAISRWIARPASKVVLAVGILGGMVAVVIAVGDGAESDTATFGVLETLHQPEAQLATARYRFRYPTILESRVKRLASRADHLHDEVAKRLGARPGSIVEVNLLRASASHAGSATWNTIRLDLANAHADAELERTLVHETTHVVALRVSDRRIQDTDETTHFFNEGLAEYLATKIVPNATDIEGRWLRAVLAHERLRIEPADLFAFSDFRARFGEDVIYPVGFGWVVALTAACGEDAPARILRALGSPDTPRNLQGTALWNHTLQGIHCDLSQVTLRWSELLKRKSNELSNEHQRVPVLIGGITGADDESIVLRAEVEGLPLESTSYLAHTRASAAADHANYFTILGESQPDGSIEFSIPTDAAEGEVLEFQLVQSWLRNGVLVSHAEKWQRARVEPQKPL